MKYIFTALVVSALLLASCKKDKDNTNTGSANAQTDKVVVKFEHTWADSMEFAMNTNLVNPITDDTLNFSTFKYYVSNIRLKKTDGSWWTEPNSYHLVDLSSNTTFDITMLGIPYGDYTDIAYVLGVDSTANVSGAQDGDLSVANNMFWSWNSGYIMLKAEGSSPQSADGTFAFHLGGFFGPDNVVTAKTHYFGTNSLTVAGNGNCQVHLSAKPETLWQTVGSVSNGNAIHMPGGAAKTMATDFFNSVAFEHIHE